MVEMEPRADSLQPVRVELWCPRGPELSWQVLRVRGREQLAQAYAFDLELACEDEDADLDAMLGADAELLFDRNGLTRVVYGIIAELQVELGTRPDELGRRARARLVPALRLLDQELDTRFFIGQSVVEILDARLGEALEPFGRSLDTSRLRGSYPRRDYCVQFGESTYDFCLRLMAEAGIAFVFEPDEDAHCERMVLIDDNASYEAVELLAGEGQAGLAFAPHEGELVERESIAKLDWRRRQRPNRVVSRAYNFKLPARLEEGEAEVFDAHHHRVRARYHHDQRRTIVDDPIEDPGAESFLGGELDQQHAVAATALERYQVEASGGRGQSNAIGFGVGRVFELAEARAVTGGEDQLLLVRVDHDATLEDGGDHTYFNHFECCPRASPFRPPLAKPKPRVQGVLTGRVAGPTLDEVHTDRFGRVKVLFHGDRHGEPDEHASCWIRVAQMWAGPGYGSLVVPRVGMEVVVSFVGGDPDQPLVTGCVYNGHHPLPVALPRDHSRSTFKSVSTPDGEGTNELRVDDAAGREQLFVRAQRRMDVQVGGSLFETTAGNREEVLGTEEDATSQHNTLIYGEHNVKQDRGARYEEIGGDAHFSTRDRFTKTSSEHHFTAGVAEYNAAVWVVEASEKVSHKANSVELAASDTLSIKGGGRVVVESNNKLELRVGMSYVVISPTRIDIESASVRINSGGQVGEASDGQSVSAFELVAPIEAYRASDGGGGSGGGTGRGGGRGRREHRKRMIQPNPAPPMTPPPPALPRKAADNKRPLVALSWDEDAVWCSEPLSLSGKVEREGDAYSDTVRLVFADNGQLFAMKATEVGFPEHYSEQLMLSDVLPRSSPIGVIEEQRMVLANVAGATTPEPVALRFLTELNAMHYTPGRSRFDISVRRGEVQVTGVLEFVRGWMHYIITLGGHVHPTTGGRIGGKVYGTRDHRYCMKRPGAGKHELVYWDGVEWVQVPNPWTNPLGTKLSGCAVWREGGTTHTQFGTLDWPEPELPEWSAGALAIKDDKIGALEHEIRKEWSYCFDFKRGDCVGENPRCCRLPMHCSFVLVERASKPRGGIVLAENYSRANTEAWSIEMGGTTAAHEVGHYLGNPDEYPGALSVDVTVNGDGAVAGLDENSLMGEGTIIRRRHYKFIAEALSVLVEDQLGKNFNYAIVDRIDPKPDFKRKPKP